MENIPKSNQKCYCFIFRWNLLLPYGDLNNCILLDPKKGHLTQFGEPVGVCLCACVSRKGKGIIPHYSLFPLFSTSDINHCLSHLFFYQNIFEVCLFTLKFCE